MCGRGVRPDGVRVVEAIEAQRVDDAVVTLPARYNLAPSEPVAVLRRAGPHRRLCVARWGVPRSRGGLAFNARAERLQGVGWRPLLGSGRAVIPLWGFYEWDARTRQPWLFRRRDGALLLLAGLVLDDGEERYATIITTEPSADVRDVHDRMPAVLEPTMTRAWLFEPASRAIDACVRPSPEGSLVGHPVSSRVDSVANDDPGLVEPAAPAAVQTELF